MGPLLALQRKQREAITQSREAFRSLHPDFPDVLNNLAWMFWPPPTTLPLRNGPEAVALWHSALAL